MQLKRLTEPVHSDDELFELQERRKLANAEKTQQKNDWILQNKKIVFFDIETFDLAADYGVIMVVCVKDRGGETRTYFARNDEEERECILKVRADLEAADYVCTYYGTKFDLPYLNTRLLISGERPVDAIRHIDLYYTSRFKLKLNRNRLKNVEMALFGTSDKTEILPGIWRKALRGDKASLDYIADHCVRDVAILENCFNALKGFVSLSSVRLRKFGASY